MASDVHFHDTRPPPGTVGPPVGPRRVVTPAAPAPRVPGLVPPRRPGTDARPVPPVRPAGRSAAEAELPEHLVPVLEQLLTGATDLTASQRLGLSPRTFSRRVSELLKHLGVLSRFQAGVAAVDTGWLDPPRVPASRRP